MPSGRGAVRKDREFQILIVDDSEADAYLMKQAWEQCTAIKSRLEMLHETRDALTFIRGGAPYTKAFVPDLVMLDYKMPLDGGVALSQLKGDPDVLHIPVIVVTGSSNPSDYLKAYRRGANCVFTKPQSLVELEQLFCHIR